MHGRRARQSLTARWQVEPLASRLREVGFEQPEQIGATFLGDADYLRALTALDASTDRRFSAPDRPAAEPTVALRSPVS